MPVRAISSAALVVACLLPIHPSDCPAQAFTPALLAAVPAADSLSPAARTILGARGAYQAAWAQRQAGDCAVAVQTAESGLRNARRVGVRNAGSRPPAIGAPLPSDPVI